MKGMPLHENKHLPLNYNMTSNRAHEARILLVLVDTPVE